MVVYLEDFREIVERLEADHIESEKYLDSLRNVDSGLSSFICETKYTDILYFQNQFIAKKLLGEDLYDWVSWYIYELPLLDKYDTDTPNCSVNGVEYKVSDLDSFMDFAQHGLLLPMKPREI